mmetsp:Transcript_11710/g.19030  ORF Transcript_11710/g.19030 Transcript_11710/m.19030 type:complete len:88 (-) Transcript_11710:325-588(-)
MIHLQLFPTNINTHTSSHCSHHSRDTSIIPSSHNFLDVTNLKATKSIQLSTTPAQSIMKTFTVTTFLLLSQVAHADFGVDARGMKRR